MDDFIRYTIPINNVNIQSDIEYLNQMGHDSQKCFLSSKQKWSLTGIIAIIFLCFASPFAMNQIKIILQRFGVVDHIKIISLIIMTIFVALIIRVLL